MKKIISISIVLGIFLTVIVFALSLVKPKQPKKVPTPVQTENTTRTVTTLPLASIDKTQLEKISKESGETLVSVPSASGAGQLAVKATKIIPKDFSGRIFIRENNKLTLTDLKVNQLTPQDQALYFTEMGIIIIFK